MRLTTKGRYAVMAMIDLAQNGGEGPIALADIAERQEISLSYLEQLFAKLRRGGLVNSVRGPGGGYLLARDTAEMRIADIILAVDQPDRVNRCTPNSPFVSRPNSPQCPSAALWEELGNQIRIFLSSVTVADVIDGTVGSLDVAFEPAARVIAAE